MGDLRPPMAAALSAFGVPAKVTPPDLASTINTAVIWLSPVLIDTPGGEDLQRKVVRRIVAVSRLDVPSVPRGLQIAAAETLGGTVYTWLVDEVLESDPDHARVIVVRQDC